MIDAGGLKVKFGSIHNIIMIIPVHLLKLFCQNNSFWFTTLANTSLYFASFAECAMYWSGIILNARASVTISGNNCYYRSHALFMKPYKPCIINCIMSN